MIKLSLLSFSLTARCKGPLQYATQIKVMRAMNWVKQQEHTKNNGFKAYDGT
jgi:hypothetical protein